MANTIGDIQSENPANRVAVSLEQMPPVPPVNPTLENQFAKLLEDERSPHDGGEHREEGQLRQELSNLKERGFRFIEKMLLMHLFSARKDGQQQTQMGGVMRGEPSHEDLSIAGLGRKIDSSLQSDGSQPFHDNLASNLGSEIAECIRHGNFANAPWRAEIGLSSNGLPATRLLIDAEEAWLRLHFVSANADVCNLLRAQRYVLLEKVSRVSSRPVIIEIDPVSTDAERDAEGGSV
ncbi:MAG TPA: type III secretion HpaP family protein [Noviherbaspirillum sp.]|nr:type III secretion HpaP family protein [Noviherbaspirillum sp.]